MQDLTLLEMIRHGWVVLTILCLCSIYSVTIMWDRYLALRRCYVPARPFLRDFIDVLEIGDFERPRQLPLINDADNVRRLRSEPDSAVGAVVDEHELLSGERCLRSCGDLL